MRTCIVITVTQHYYQYTKLLIQSLSIKHSFTTLLKLFSSCKIHVHTYVAMYLHYVINYDVWIHPVRWGITTYKLSNL